MGYIIAIIILIMLSAFFSACETALTSVNRIRLKNKAENGSRRAKKVLNMLDKYDKALTTILIGNNIVNITTSSLATILFVSMLGEDTGALVSTIAVTIVVLIFGEIMPKTIAKNFADEFCLIIADILPALMIVFTPLSAFFSLLQKIAKKFLNKKGKSVSVTEQELMHIIDEIKDEGVLEEQESILVRSALEFDETTAETVLTPRVDVVAIELNTPNEDVLALFMEENYSRLPVYDRTIDHIVGVVTQKDFYQSLILKKDFTIGDIMQETLHVPSLMPISEIIKIMQKKKTHMAVVVDQYGGTQGILTLEDILEELVGEIWDESDEITSPIKFVSDNVFELEGSLSQNDFNKYFEHSNMDFEINSDANTVGGWVLELFGKIPEPFESVRTSDFVITVLTCGERKISRLRFKILQKK